MTLYFRKVKYLGTHCQECICRGIRRLEEIYPDTHRLEEIRPDTHYLEEIYLDTQRLDGNCPSTCRLKEICLHQEKKSASGRTGCIRTHQALRRLWTYPGRAHTTPNAKRTGNVNSDTALHGSVHSDAVCQGAVHPDAARHGICLPEGVCQAIFLLDTAVSGHFPSGCSHVRANGVRMTRVMAPRSCCLLRHGTL